MKNIIVVTGGAGFIGSSLIERLLIKTKLKIISIDNYISGSVKNHIRNKRIKYIRGSTQDIFKILKKYKKSIKLIYHFGEFSRIAQSFKNIDTCIQSNIYGSNEVVKFCMLNKIKIIYSATSAAFGNNFEDQNLSPYSFTKTNILNLILNYHSWFKLDYSIIYFYNVYGKRQIYNNKMAAVIGVFENCIKKNKPLPVVKPGNQSRIFTHVDDVIDGCIRASSNKKIKHLCIRAKKSYTILEVAKMFNHRYKLTPPRPGERFKSSFPKKIRGVKVYEHIGKIKLKNYIKEIYESC